MEEDGPQVTISLRENTRQSLREFKEVCGYSYDKAIRILLISHLMEDEKTWNKMQQYRRLLHRNEEEDSQ